VEYVVVQGLYSATLLLLVWSGYRYRLQQISNRYALRFEERIGERSRIARELHDTLLQGFQGLMFRLQALRDLLPERPNEAIPILETALELGDQAVIEARDAVQGLRSSAAINDDLLHSLTLLAQELGGINGSPAPVAFRLLVEGQPRVLRPMLRDEVYRIAREALGNAFRHAQAQRIEVEVTYGDKLFTLKVRDDGRGIDPGVRDRGQRSGHWGLAGMRERAKAFGGTLEVWSQQAAGTEIALTVPGFIAFVQSRAPGFSFLRRRTERYEPGS
jgi:signal transduction histidine kinase